MNQISHEYVGAIVIVVISVLKIFGVELGTEEVTSIVTGLVAVYVAFRRYQKKDISLGGVKK